MSHSKIFIGSSNLIVDYDNDFIYGTEGVWYTSNKMSASPYGYGEAIDGYYDVIEDLPIKLLSVLDNNDIYDMTVYARELYINDLPRITNVRLIMTNLDRVDVIIKNCDMFEPLRSGTITLALEGATARRRYITQYNDCTIVSIYS